LRIINGQNNTSGEKTRMLDPLAKLFKAIEVELYVDKTIGQLIKVRTPCWLKKRSRLIAKTRHNKFSFALSAH